MESPKFMSETIQIDTQHSDLLHSVEMDYYGKRIATSSSDKTIKVFNIVNEKYLLSATLEGHLGAVWQASWAHPRFGSILASCSSDQTVIVWSEAKEGQWTILHRHQLHTSSVNSLCWAPQELGVLLVCGSSDGHVSILKTSGNGVWDTEKWKAHEGGCLSVHWAPYQISSETSQENPQSLIRIATGGCDNLVKIWSFNNNSNEWNSQTPDFVLNQHSDWIRDLAWCPSYISFHPLLVSTADDKKVLMWIFDKEKQIWNFKKVGNSKEIVWKVCWSLSGHLLSLSSIERTTVWKQNDQEEWVLATDLPLMVQ